MLFKKDQSPAMRVEPVPASDLEQAQKEFHDASIACRQSAEVCTRLDAEQKNWLSKRESAQTDFNAALARYSAAQDQLAKLQSTVVSATGKISATGTTQPISNPAGAVLP